MVDVAVPIKPFVDDDAKELAGMDSLKGSVAQCQDWAEVLVVKLNCIATNFCTSMVTLFVVLQMMRL